MYARTMFSSSPTVETKYALAQKCSPVKFFWRPPNLRAIWIALFPFRYPTTFETAYFGGMLTQALVLFHCESPFSWQRSEIHADRRKGQTLVSPPAEPGAYLYELKVSHRRNASRLHRT